MLAHQLAGEITFGILELKELLWRKDGFEILEVFHLDLIFAGL